MIKKRNPDPGTFADTVRPEDVPDDEIQTGEPLADKSDVTAPMHDSGAPANDARPVPGVDPDSIDAMREASVQELDLEDGRLREETLTQDESVIEAESADRGSPTHLEEPEEQTGESHVEHPGTNRT